MVRVKPFSAIRPPREMVSKVAAPPYDVLDSAEAAAQAGPESLLHITRPEIDFCPPAGENERRSYDKAVENFRLWQERGWLRKDPGEFYYLYSQTMGDHTQYGIVLCAYAPDYENGRIRKHELTRRDKEDDRMVHVRIQNANIEPVFFAYKDNARLNAVMEQTALKEPEYDYADANGFIHRFWVIDSPEDIQTVTDAFQSEVEAFYVADGHHRTAAAARVCKELSLLNPFHTGEEEYNFFLAVCFPQSRLKVMDYNRVVRDLNGLSPDEFLSALSRDFTVECKGESEYRPQGLHNFSMYLQGRWYSLDALPGRYDDSDPLKRLDVETLSRCVLDRILGIKDLRTDKRIDFVGGIRGLGELRSRVDSGEMAVAFALYPVSMEQIMDIADKGAIMPPKTTWFEPKLQSGLAIHSLD
ncbi:MAG: DUF1015 domain-containing protein [Bacteroidales bacterium]|nr:DUF1015 domain-containing protein [Bacteroidales bacterium]